MLTSLLHPLIFLLLLLQPCMERASLGRKQTLTYLKGYPQQDPDPSGLMSCGEPALSSTSRIGASWAAQPSALDTSTNSSCSPKSPGGTLDKVGAPLPKFVEQDRQVRMMPGPKNGPFLCSRLSRPARCWHAGSASSPSRRHAASS